MAQIRACQRHYILFCLAKKIRGENMFKRLLYIIILIQGSTIYAERPEIEFRHLKVRDGLSQSWVKSICQDRYGFMWFGTNDGLNKYDGYNFTIYRHDPEDENSLTDNIIESIYEDKNGNLWIGTESGLNIYDRENDNFISNKSWPMAKYTDFIELEDGRLYIGCSIGLLLYNPKNDSTILFPHDVNDTNTLINEHVCDILMDKNGNIWIATLAGLDLLDKSNHRFIHFTSNNKRNSISDNEIRSLYLDSKDRIWLGTKRGLDLLKYKKGQPEKPTFVNYQNNPRDESSVTDGSILELMEDKYGKLWIGIENGGLDILDLNNFEEDNCVFYHYTNDPADNTSLSYNSIYSLYEDRDCSVWVGTFGDGISMYNKLIKNFKHYKSNPNNPNSISNNYVNAFLEEDNYVWIGTEGGLNLFDKKKQTFKHFIHNPGNSKSIGSNAIFAIKKDRRNNLWIGTWAGGLNLFNRKTNTFTRYMHNPNDSTSIGSNNIFGIIESREGNLWIASMSGGLNLFDYKKRTFKRYKHLQHVETSISGDWVRTVLEDSYGKIWLSTSRVVDMFDKEKEIFIHFRYDSTDSRSISHRGANTFLEDSKRNLWIGTNRGLNVFNREDSSFDCYTEKDGLPNNQIMGILEDNHGNLWISTNRGISKFINGINRPEEPTFKNYDISDGLAGNEFNRRSCFKGKDGKLYFGGKNGFNVFHPDSIKGNPYIPDIVLTHFLIFNKPVEIGTDDSPLSKHISLTEELILSHKQSVISIQYAALNFLTPEKCKFAFMLEGFEKEWNYVGNKREATYTNLDPGTYIFRVKGTNNDGIWDEEGISLKIIVTPPFWRTIWFRLSMIILIIIAAYTTHRIRVRSIVAYGRRLKKFADALERSNKELKEFAHIIAHDLKVPLRGVNQLAEWTLEDYSEALDKKGKNNLELLKKRTKFMNEMIQSLLDYSKIGRDKHKEEDIDLNKTLDEVINSLSLPSNVKIVIENRLPKYKGDSGRVPQIFENLIGNAIKYGDKKEMVIKINCTPEDNQWKFSVSDNGPGIEENYFEKIFQIFETLDTKKTYKSMGIGLTIVKKIVETEGGKIWVESEAGSGTTFYFTLPKE